MGTGTIPERLSGQTILKSFFNVFRDALNGNVVPRNTSGVATDQAGGLGTSLLRWGTSYFNKFYVGDPADLLSVENDGAGNLQVKQNAVLGGLDGGSINDDSAAARAILPMQLGTGIRNVSIGSQINTGSLTNTTYAAVTNGTVDLDVTGGGAVFIMLFGGFITLDTGTATQASMEWQIKRDTTALTPSSRVDNGAVTGTSRHFDRLSSTSVFFVDTPTAGNYTYSLEAKLSVGGSSRLYNIENAKMLAVEF